jgi:hypothetical protein
MQASEKVLKCFIHSRGEKFRRIHLIAELHQAAIQLGLTPIDLSRIAELECSANARYGQESSLPDQAYRAYWLSLMTCGEVAKQLSHPENP